MVIGGGWYRCWRLYRNDIALPNVGVGLFGPGLGGMGEGSRVLAFRFGRFFIQNLNRSSEGFWTILAS